LLNPSITLSTFPSSSPTGSSASVLNTTNPIEETWTDMRPLTLRQKMDEQAAEKTA